MDNFQILSNSFIDSFIEKLPVYGVKAEDISFFLDSSIQFEITERYKEKLLILDSLLLNIRTKYPQIWEHIQKESEQLYIETEIDSLVYLDEMREATKKIMEEISKLNESVFINSVFELGLEVALILNKYIKETKNTIDKESFYQGLELGFGSETQI